MKASTKRTLRVWQYRGRALLWVVIGAASFLFGFSNSVVMVWIASLYANIGTDLGSAEAADDRELIRRLDRIEANQAKILQLLGATEPDGEVP